MTSSTSPYRTKAGASFNIPVELDLREGKRKPIPAHLMKVNTGFFQLSSPVFLQSNTTIDILFDRQRLEVEVVFCKADDRDGYAVGARLMPGLNGEIRREPRVPVEISARVTSSDLPISIPAKLVDISRSGLGLRMSRCVPVGSGAVVELPGGIAFGEVRHCTLQAKETWRIGLSLDEFISNRDRAERTSCGFNESLRMSGFGLNSLTALLKRMFAVH